MPITTSMRGLVVCPGLVSGKARVITSPQDIDNIEDGELLVLPHSHAMYALAIMKAAGVICEKGGKLSHLCAVSMELGIPCVIQVHEATKIIATGDYLTMDATIGEVIIHG